MDYQNYLSGPTCFELRNDRRRVRKRVREIPTHPGYLRSSDNATRVASFGYAIAASNADTQWSCCISAHREENKKLG
jgi:hypothetical protein